MARVILFLLWIGVTVFAIADWARTPEENTPARLPRMAWLLIILITIPSFSIGALAWIIMRWVQRKEEGTETTPGGPLFGGLGSIVGGSGRFSGSSGKRGFGLGGRGSGSDNDATPMAPDDDPDYLFKLERDIQRRKREAERFEEERRRKQQNTSDKEDTSDGSGNEA